LLSFCHKLLFSIPFFPHSHAAVMGCCNKMTANKSTKHLKISKRSHLYGYLISHYRCSIEYLSGGITFPLGFDRVMQYPLKCQHGC
jgi:hypothetical protein